MPLLMPRAVLATRPPTSRVHLVRRCGVPPAFRVMTDLVRIWRMNPVLPMNWRWTPLPLRKVEPIGWRHYDHQLHRHQPPEHGSLYQPQVHEHLQWQPPEHFQHQPPEHVQYQPPEHRSSQPPERRSNVSLRSSRVPIVHLQCSLVIYATCGRNFLLRHPLCAQLIRLVRCRLHVFIVLTINRFVPFRVQQ